MISLLRKRRSIRKFTSEKVSPKDLEVIIEAALRSPSSRGNNPWEFIIVDDGEKLKQLSKAKMHGSEFIENAPLAIVVCADSSKSDVWVEDCSIAAILIQLTALSLGLGSCWAQIRKREHDRSRTAQEYLKELFDLPDAIMVECIIGIGRINERKIPVPAGKLQRDKIRMNSWK